MYLKTPVRRCCKNDSQKNLHIIFGASFVDSFLVFYYIVLFKYIYMKKIYVYKKKKS